jgi:glycosyltransferase involved in cell wall biosynthesis
VKLLFVAGSFPYPLDAGARNHIYHWLETASQVHEVDLIVVGNAEHGPQRIPGLPRVRVDVLTPAIRRTLAARLARFLSSVGAGIPATSLVLMASVERARILTRACDSTYDAVILADNSVACYAPFIAAGRPVLILKHSVQAVDARDMRLRRGRWNPRWLLEEWIVRRFEARTCRSGATLCCVDQEDAREVSRRYGTRGPIAVVPVGVDLTRFNPRSHDPGNDYTAFFGNLTWGANLDAVNWFAEKVLPLIWEARPQVRFRIIGRGSDNLRFRRADSRIECVGRVPDIPEALSDITVGVVPVVSGTGIRFKLLELMSIGVPAVTTSLGRAGVDVTHGKHCLVADTPSAFADAVLLLLSDPPLRLQLSQAALGISRQTAWDSIYPRVLSTLAEVVGPKQRSLGADAQGAASGL